MRSTGVASIAAATAMWVETDEHISPRPSAGWTVVQENRNGRAYVQKKSGLRVFFTLDEYPHPDVAGKSERWLHLSVSREKRLPNWEELREVKQTFMPDMVALQVLPPISEYVNFHPYVLHLWVCLDRRPTPDFRIQGLI